jgi:hypothetical protein
MKNAVFWDIKPSSYLTGNTLRLGYRAQPVNVMQHLWIFTMKNAVFWDVNSSSYLTGNTLRLGYTAQPVNVMQHLRFFTMKNAVFWDVTLCSSCKKSSFEGTCLLHHNGDKNRLAVTTNRSMLRRNTMCISRRFLSEMSVLTRATRRHIPEVSMLL